MTITQSILLGVVQGLTEFLPISSSGHLVIIPYLLGWDIPASVEFTFDVLVQVATLVAVFAFFWNDLSAIACSFVLGIVHKKPFADPLSRQGWFIVLATLPAGIIGLVLRKPVQQAFNSAFVTAGFLFLTAVLLLFAEKAGRRNRCLESMTWKDALWIGFFQAIAIFPGVSRSGATIVGGMTRDLQRPAAARFSFLISIPIMLAAGLITIVDLLRLPNLSPVLPSYIPGFITAAIVGYLAIRWLLAYLTRHPLYVFAFYCALLGLFVISINSFGQVINKIASSLY